MRVLFTNLAELATITAGSYASQYIPDNVVHPYLKTRYQAEIGSTSDSLTFEFTSDQTINCIFIGWHSLSQISFDLQDSGSSSLYSDTWTLSGDVVERIYFSAVSAVRKVILSLTSAAAPLYLGGVGFGQYYQMPDFMSLYPIEVINNAVFSKSNDGQSSQNYIKPLRGYEFDYREMTREKTIEIIDNYNLVGRKALFVDIFEGAGSNIKPIYCNINTNGLQKDFRRYRQTLSLEEAR